MLAWAPSAPNLWLMKNIILKFQLQSIYFKIFPLHKVVDHQMCPDLRLITLCVCVSELVVYCNIAAIGLRMKFNLLQSVIDYISGTGWVMKMGRELAWKYWNSNAWTEQWTKHITFCHIKFSFFILCLHLLTYTYPIYVWACRNIHTQIRL